MLRLYPTDSHRGGYFHTFVVWVATPMPGSLKNGFAVVFEPVDKHRPSLSSRDLIA